MDAADHASGPAATEPGVATGDRTAKAQADRQTVPAAPVRVAPATARLTVAAARQASARATPAAPRTRPMAPPRTTPVVRPPNHPVPAAVPPPRIVTRGSRVKEFLARLALIQVVCWQVAVVAVVLTIRQSVPVLVCVSVGAVVLVALTTVRIDGRWLYQHGVVAVDYLSRRRRRDLPGDAGKAPALLDLLIPGCTVRAIETGHGVAMTTSHRGGLTAVLRAPDGGTDLVDRLPTPAALLSLIEGQQHALGVQTTYHAGVRRDGPAKVWLAVHAVRAVDVPGDDELTLVLRNAMRRMRRPLGRAGVPTEPLTEEAALAVIAGLAHVTGGRNEVREHWRFWRTGAVCQATFHLHGWHRLTDSQARRLISDLFAVSGVAVTVTVTARLGPNGPRGDGVLRLAGTTEAAVEAAHAEMTVRAAPCGIALLRLNGAHSRGVAASLPIGVFLT
ncbi:hypothetical protein WEI85_24860 [Actinomycetes bacterium KLBMP 9797]